MNDYNDTISKKKSVELIHVSEDQDEDAAEDWAVKESFPWPTILPKHRERSGLEQYHNPKSVPFYILVDENGKEIAKGKAEAMKAIAGLD